MVKPEWGTKRTCPSCEVKFYDLHRNPIYCPKCNSLIETESLSKPQRLATRKLAKATAIISGPVTEDIDLDLPVVEEESDILTEIDENGGHEVEEDENDLGRESNREEEDLIEDTSDLGVDDDDMAEVMEHLEDEHDA